MKQWDITLKESVHPPGKRFSRALESRFVVPKNEAHGSYFHLTGPFSWDMGHLVSNILYFVKKWCLLLTAKLQVFKIRKRGKEIIKVDSKS